MLSNFINWPLFHGPQGLKNGYKLPLGRRYLKSHSMLHSGPRLCGQTPAARLGPSIPVSIYCSCEIEFNLGRLDGARFYSCELPHVFNWSQLKTYLEIVHWLKGR